MIESLLPLLAAGMAIAFWLDALAARELAGRYSRQLCSEANLQWLDQSIALQRMGFVRVNRQWVLRRQYRFEVSFDGTDRHRASINLHGRRVANYTLPVRESLETDVQNRLSSPT